MTLRLSPLDSRHRSLDATMTDFAGWSMPLRYHSELAEHEAVRSAAGLFDLSHMGELRISGREAAPALASCVTGDVSEMELGRAKYTLVCNPDGGVIDDIIVYREATDSFLLVANAANAARVLDEISVRANSYDCIVADDSSATALIAVQGPAARTIVAELTGGDAAVATMRYYSCVNATVVDDIPAIIARTGYTGEDGYELFVQAPDAGALWDAALEIGTPMDMVPAGLAARNTLRLEAGMPLYGNELSEKVLPEQAGIGWAVTLDPDSPRDFVGAEALAASKEAVAAWRGYPVTAPDDARLLVGLVGEGRRAARDECVVYSDRGDEVGVVTSGVLSPTLGRPIAMAFVHPEFATEGSTVVVDVRGRELPMTVVRLPFYRRSQ